MAHFKRISIIKAVIKTQEPEGVRYDLIHHPVKSLKP